MAESEALVGELERWVRGLGVDSELVEMLLRNCDTIYDLLLADDAFLRFELRQWPETQKNLFFGALEEARCENLSSQERELRDLKKANEALRAQVEVEIRRRKDLEVKRENLVTALTENLEARVAILTTERNDEIFRAHTAERKCEVLEKELAALKASATPPETPTDQRPKKNKKTTEARRKSIRKIQTPILWTADFNNDRAWVDGM